MEPRNSSIKPDSRPLYDQAIDALMRYVEEGGYKPGDKLPGEAELARALGISRPTLREAMGSLECKGIIDRRHGVGTFITAPVYGLVNGGLERLESMYSLAANAGVAAERSDWVVEACNATEALAEKLVVSPGTALFHVQTTIKEKERYFAYMSSYVPAQWVQRTELEAFTGGSLLDYLLVDNESRLSYTYTNLYSVSAGENEARWLHVPLERPLLLLEETFFSEAGVPVVWTRNYFMTDNVNFHLIRRIMRAG